MMSTAMSCVARSDAPLARAACVAPFMLFFHRAELGLYVGSVVSCEELFHLEQGASEPFACQLAGLDDFLVLL